ncbi:hypothetical protein [Ahrensia sp. 13_GOM-1096m]|uniref:sunset domain-containing protein n=1 Tax=Ahrensia sp. 13_GOM-1096m TaxID=1380380 RepID=UPI00047D603A|nr:hypothetical protein [Ahrensia sp. 13_GOM-1096m]
MSFFLKAGGLVGLAFVGGAAVALAPPELNDKAADIAAAYGLRSDCVIKGNVSIGSREKIYHVPGQEYYLATNIRTKYGERWFCTEADARAAGWRKAGR